MSVVNLLEWLHSPRRREHLFSDGFTRADFYSIAATDTDVPIEIFSASFLRWRGEAVKTAKKPSDGIVASKFTLRSL